MIYRNGKESTPKLNGVDLSKVMYNGKQIWPKIVTEIALADTKAGDVLLWDKTNQRKLFTSSDNLSNYPADSYTPIGVVVIPGSHNVYGDGSCGVMSLKAMNGDTPSTGGTSEQKMCWGEYDTDISALPNLNRAPIVGSGLNVGNASSTVTGEEYYPYLPSDKFSAVQCPHDTDAYYYSSESTYNQAPSPYLTDGSRNPAYYQTSSPSSEINALADFDGIGNTEKIITERGTKDYNSWTPDRLTESDYPAASCCDMYFTEGTNQGDWYLPAMGEIGYIIPPFNKINNVIEQICTAYGSSVGVELGTNLNYWSSTECSSGCARRVYTYNGYVYFDYKCNYHYARAFLKVSPLDLSSSGISHESASNGVYVYANNGKLYNPDNWDTANNDLALGIAVVTDNSRFAISKELPMMNNIAWSDTFSLKKENGILTTESQEEVITDYIGRSNTNIIMVQYNDQDESNNASYYCDSQILNGKNGYLPAAGELYAVWENKTVINNALKVIGSIDIDTRLNNMHDGLLHRIWSSTAYSLARPWDLWWQSKDFPLNDTYAKSSAYPECFAFPVFPITDTVTLTVHIASLEIPLHFRKGDSINLSYYVPSAYTSVFMGWHKLEDLSDEMITQIDSIQNDMILYANTGNTPDNP